MRNAHVPLQERVTLSNALAEVAIVLAVGSGKSPIPIVQQADTIGRVLARSNFVQETLNRSVSEADIPDIERRLCQWSHRILLDWRGMTRQKKH